MWGFQAAGAAPLVLGHPVEHPETVATAIRIGNPASWEGAVTAREESEGQIDSVTDEEILAAYRRLAATEGVFCEPASAASVAGLLKHAAAGTPLEGLTAVCVITGHGLKDPDTAMTIEAVRHNVPADLAAVERSLGWR
jgi:threonine synthase